MFLELFLADCIAETHASNWDDLPMPEDDLVVHLCIRNNNHIWFGGDSSVLDKEMYW